MEMTVDERRKKAHKRNQRNLFVNGMLYLSPAVILLCVFLFYPMFKTLYLSFFSVGRSGMTEEFVGLEHYISIFTSIEFLRSLGATLLFVVYLVPGQIIISLFLAVIASEKLKGVYFFRAIFSSTLGVSVAAASAVWLFMFSPSLGFLNMMLNSVGLSGVDWLQNSTWALISVAATTAWMHIGINFIILTAGIQSVPKDYYESATIDGAGYWAKLFKITIPLISPVLLFVLIVAIIGSFQTFGQIDLLTGGGPNGATNLIVYSIYKQAFSYGHFGMASAQAIVLFIIILITTLIQFNVGEKKVHYQ